MKNLVEYKGEGFVTVTQPANEKQMSAKQVEKVAFDVMQESYSLITVNNGTDSRKVNPRMREHAPDNRVYTLQLTKSFNRQNKRK